MMIGVQFGNFCSSCFIKISVSFYVEIIIFPIIFDGQTPMCSMVMIPPLRGNYHILWMTAKQSRCIGKTVSRDKKTAGIIDESQYRFQPAIQGTAEYFKQRHAGHQQFLTKSRQTLNNRLSLTYFSSASDASGAWSSHRDNPQNLHHME